MRVVLADNVLLDQRDGEHHFDLQPHLGLISLIAVAEQAGHDCTLYDPKLGLARGVLPLDRSLYLRMANDILATDPDVVGFTSLGCNFICTLKVAAHIRRIAPEIPLLLGGPHASILDRPILDRWRQFDAIVRGEAEATILRILAASAGRDFDGISGVTYRAGDAVVANAPAPIIERLDDLPRAAYHSYPIEQLGGNWLRVEAGRGCPFSCTFCSTASFFGRRYRLKSAARLVAELDELNKLYDVSHFALTHDLFTVNKAKVAEFCTAVRNREYTWTCSARMDCVTPDLLAQMSEAGCSSIYYGVETGSSRMQEIVRKRLDLSLFFPTLRTTAALGMAATASFITGYPEEGKSDQDETLDLMGACFYECEESLTLQLHLLTPEPGTRLISEYGDSLEYDGHITDFNFPTLEPDDATIMHDNPEVFMNHHYFPSAVPRRRNIVVTSIRHALLKLGFAVLREILDHHKRRLSLLMDEIVAWADSERDPGPFDGDLLVRFVTATLGPEHHLTSLVRYMLASADLSLADPANLPEGADRGYVLSSRATLLRDVHECPTILAAMVDGGIPRPVPSRRASYVLVRDDAPARTVRNFEIDEGSADFLEQFRHPTPLTGLDVDAEGAAAIVERLVGLGVLREIGAAVPTAAV